MSEKNDFFQKKLSNTRSFRRQQSSSRSRIWIILGVLILGAGIFWVYRLFLASPNLDNVEEQPSPFSLGQEITLRGVLVADGDILTYTHTIMDETFGNISVKSKSVGLGDYDGVVEATGIVEKFYQGKPIVEISSLSGAKIGMQTTNTNIVLDDASGEYILGAGIHFLPAFLEEFMLLNEGENWEIRIQDLDTEQEISVNYFRCNSANPDKNCKGLVETFAQTSARSFVTSNGDTYYKLSETNSWFVANGDWWGVFINDVPEDTVMKLKDLMVFANERVMKNWVDFASTRVCQSGEEALQLISDYSFSLKQEGLVATLKGQGRSHSLECTVLIDFSLPQKGQLISLSIEGALPSVEETSSPEPVVQDIPVVDLDTSTSETNTSSSQERNPDVAQFPLNIERGLVYTSSRGGYSLQFPSANISYASSSVRENFGQASLTCSYVINVIKYTDKDDLEISPAMRIYECDVRGDISSPGMNYLIRQGAGKTFVVEINDSSWIDFANSLSFTALE